MDIFETCTRSQGDLAGVFEYDGETGYFYLYDTQATKNKVLGAIHIVSGRLRFAESEIHILWNDVEDKVGLFIEATLWAVFGSDGASYGGKYRSDGEPSLPSEAKRGFKSA